MLKLIHYKKFNKEISMENIILQLIKKYINFKKNMNFVNMISMIQNNSHLFFG